MFVKRGKRERETRHATAIFTSSKRVSGADVTVSRTLLTRRKQLRTENKGHVEANAWAQTQIGTRAQRGINFAERGAAIPLQGLARLHEGGGVVSPRLLRPDGCFFTALQTRPFPSGNVKYGAAPRTFHCDVTRPPAAAAAAKDLISALWTVLTRTGRRKESFVRVALLADLEAASYLPI